MADWRAGPEPADECDRRSYLATVLETASEAIIGLTTGGIITGWNPAAERLFGHTAGQIIGHPFTELILAARAPLLQSEVLAQFERAWQGQPLRDYQVRAVRREGTPVDVALSVSPVTDPAGRVTGAVAVTRDITEHMRSEVAHWAQERERQTERIQTVAQVAGSIAHDFNNLLSTIMGYGGLLAEATTGDANADAQQILLAARRGSWLARALLIFSQRAPARPEPLDLNQLLADERSLLAASTGDRITLHFQTTPLAPVLCDRGQIEQLLLNLAFNARDAMPEGGTLTIATRTVDAGEWRGGMDTAAGHASWVELTVTDTGYGMSPQIAQHVFEPFFSTKPRTEGTAGLGLATVWNIVTAAGGTVSVESEEGMGTTFRVYLPALDVTAEDGEAKPGPLPRGRGERVLVADDDQAVLEVTTRILRGNGYQTLAAGNIEEILATLSEQDVQLLLTDSVMPGMSDTFAERIRELDPGLRIMHMSGYSPPSSASENIDFISKPFTGDALVQTVRRVLDAPAR